MLKYLILLAPRSAGYDALSRTVGTMLLYADPMREKLAGLLYVLIFKIGIRNQVLYTNIKT